MRLSARSLFFICWTVANWAFSFGLGSQLVSHWLHSQGQSDTVIGYGHAFYYLGMAVASFAAPLAMRWLGAIRCVTMGLILTGVTLAIFPWSEHEGVWYVLRCLNGWGGALCVIPFETLVSRDAPPAMKTRYFAYYGVAITLGGALGFVLTPPLGEASYPLAFLIGGIVCVVAAFTLVLGMLGISAHSDFEIERTPLAWRANFLAYATAWCQGFLEGGMVAFLQLFLIWRGFDNDDAGILMGVTTVGVIFFQVPVSWLADRYGKTPILLLCYAVVAFCLLTIPVLSHLVVLAAILFTFGACTGAMYPLGLSLLGDRIPASGLARAYAWFLIVECVGSVAGAAVMGHARDDWGETSMFAIGFLCLLAVLMLALLLRVSDRRSESAGELDTQTHR